MQTNIIICKIPKLDGLSSRLVGTSDDYQFGQFYMDFNKINSLEDIIERLDWMESRGYHLVNSRGVVWSSRMMGDVVQQLTNKMPKNPMDFQFRFLTRSGNLRSQVIKLVTGDEGVDSDEFLV